MSYLTPFVFLFCLVLAQVAPSAAIAESKLVSMTGTWSGGGFIRPKNFDEKQRVRCKLKATEKRAGKTTLAGRCATANRSHRITLDITETANGKKVISVARVSGSAKTFEHRGRRTRTGFILKIAKPIQQHGRTISSTMSILLPGRNRLTISETITDMISGEKINSVSLTLTK